MSLSLRVLDFYASVFARPVFRKFNTFVYLLGLRGLGIFNWRDEYLSGEHHFLLRMAQILDQCRDAIAIDIGANRGDYSVALLQMTQSCQVHAFEPHPLTLTALSQRAESLPAKQKERLHIHTCALGDSDDSTTLFDCQGSDGSPYASLYEKCISGIWQQATTAHAVELRKLDSEFNAEQLPQIRFLKIDTEGHELSVLRGAALLLKQENLLCVQIEFNEMNAVSKSFLSDFIEVLPRHFKAYRLLPYGALLPLDPYVIWQAEIFGFQNIVFLNARRLMVKNNSVHLLEN